MLTITHFHEERDIAFTSDFCNNHSHPASPASLFLTSPRPLPTRPRVPYLMSSSPSSRVPKSQVPTHASRCPRPLVPVPLLYTAAKCLISAYEASNWSQVTFFILKNVLTSISERFGPIFEQRSICRRDRHYAVTKLSRGGGGV